MTELAIQTQTAAAGAAATTTAGAGASEVSFGDFVETLIDIVNPLQHLPVVSTLYRSLTGDEIAAPAQLIGGALFGGALGVAGAAVNLVIEDMTGRDIGDHALALLDDEDAPLDPQLASTDSGGFSARPNPPAFGPDGDADELYAETWNGSWFPRESLAARRSDLPAPRSAVGDQLAVNAPSPTPTPTPNDALPAVADSTLAAVSPQASASPASDSPPATTLMSKDQTAPNQTAPNQTPTPPAPTAPAWLAAALADAEQGRGAAAAGRDTAEKPAPEWISSAMAHALDKYQAMAIARSGNDALSRIGNGGENDN